MGDFRLDAGEAPVTRLDSPRLQSLLAYLLLHRDAPQSRQHLAFLLFPDSTEPQARTNLRHLLHLLRQSLPDPDRFFQSDAQTLQWRADAPFTLDVDRFERAVAQASTPAELQAAVDLYRGDLLPGCYDDWIQPERERLRQKLVAALERLSQQLEEQGETRGALAAADQLLRLDPLREESYRRLMRLHALRGDRAAVARAFNDCAAVLKRDLGVEPSAETRAAFQQALQDHAAAGHSPPRPPSHNLPVPLTSFIGRAQQVAEIKRLLSTTRFLTLTGAGGSGKTRLALQVAGQVADSFKDGAWWVEFAPLSDPALVPQEVARALGVQPAQQQAPADALQEYLRPRQLLLILDNCEHLLDACAALTHQLLAHCPHLRILATSRELFGAAGETVWQVPTMTVPDSAAVPSPELLLRYEGVALFVERARAAKPDFAVTAQNAPAIAQVCQRLDGIPLALELAAARARLLKVENIAARLDDRFTLLTSGSRDALPRHQTLRGTMDWSHDLLTAEAQTLFRRLSLFAGGFTLAAAQAVCSDENLTPLLVLDLLSRLVDRSLVMVDHQGEEERYRLLETIRQYAGEKLDASGEANHGRDRHLDFFLGLAEEAEPRLYAPNQFVWLRRLELEHDNLRAALKWSLEGGDADKGLRLAAALHIFWCVPENVAEGARWLKETLACASPAPSRARAEALLSVAEQAFGLGEFEAWGLYGQEALRVGQELEDTRLIALALMHIGWSSIYRGEVVAARPLIDRALELARELGDKWLLSYTLRGVASAISREDNAAALPLFEQALAISREAGDTMALSEALYQFANVLFVQQDYSRAKALYRESIELFSTRGIEGDYAPLNNLGDLLEMEGDIEGASQVYVEGISWAQRTSAKLIVALSVAGLGGVAAARGQPQRAARLLGAAEAQLEAMGSAFSRWPNRLATHNRRLESTRRQLDEATFEALRAEGRALTLDQAVAYALDQTIR